MKSANLIIKKIEKLEKLINEKSNPPLWLSIDQLSRYINLSTSAIRRLVSTDRIPYQRVGNTNKLTFNRKQIDYWLLTRSKSPNKRDRNRMKEFIND